MEAMTPERIDELHAKAETEENMRALRNQQTMENFNVWTWIVTLVSIGLLSGLFQLYRTLK